jgi:hypothetical protein
MIWNPKVRARTQDTRFIQVRVAGVATYVLFRVVLCRALGVVPGAIVDVWLGTRPLYIVQGAGS